MKMKTLFALTAALAVLSCAMAACAEDVFLIDLDADSRQETAAPAGAPYLSVDTSLSQSPEDELTLSFLGDCSVGDTVRVIKRKNTMTGMISANGPEWLFSTVSDILHADDFTFANLECVLTDNMVPLYPLKVYNLVGPSSHREVLRYSGIDGVNTVNNHCIDFKYAGYEDTLRNLEDVGIVPIGTLNPSRENNRYVSLGRLDIKGVRIGVTGYTYPIDDAVLDFIREDIRLLREEGCQIVIVSLHWGTEEKKTPDKGQFAYARKILDAGADMIWGHHPHVLQPVYFYGGKPILFSTGNFVFSSIKNLDPASGIFRLTWTIRADGEPVLSEFSMVPTEIRHRKEYRPLLLEDEKSAQKCWKHVIGRDMDGFERLPDGFALSGRVRIGEDGSLTAADAE